jgi:hypothetical protein
MGNGFLKNMKNRCPLFTRALSFRLLCNHSWNTIKGAQPSFPSFILLKFPSLVNYAIGAMGKSRTMVWDRGLGIGDMAGGRLKMNPPLIHHCIDHPAISMKRRTYDRRSDKSLD